jgi:hypothetical protein
VTYSSGTSTSGKVGVYFGSSEQSTYTTTSNKTIKGQSKTDEWTNSTAGNGYFQLSTSSKNVQITKIVITYTPSSSSDPISLESISLNKTSTSIDLLNEDETIREIARIASGKITEISIEHAKELRNIA